MGNRLGVSIAVGLFIVHGCLSAAPAAPQTAPPCSSCATGRTAAAYHTDEKPKCLAATREITCKPDGTGYLYTFTVTNNTGQAVTSVLVTPPVNSNFTITPQMPPLPGGVLANGQSVTLQVTIAGGQAGQQICFAVTLMTRQKTCCTVNVCVVLPSCCGTLRDLAVKCNEDGSFTYTVSITNNTPNTVQHIYFYAPPGVTMTPSYFAVNLAPGATSQPLVIQITGAQPGAKICFDVSLHTAEMKSCCTFEHCIKLPTCGPPPVDVSLAKGFAKGPAGGTGAFTLAVKNEGAPIAPGTTIKITDPVPAGVTLTGLGGASGANWSCAPAFPVSGPGTLTCAYTGSGTIATGAPLPPLVLNATLASAGSEIGIYENCATVALASAAGPVTESNTANNRACALTSTINPAGCGTGNCPQPAATCKQDVLMVVDASLSIGPGLATVKAAIGKFLQAMQNKGGRVDIFSFNNQPNWTPITGGWTAVTSANASTLANPIVLGGTRTNWDDALERAYNVVVAASPNKPLVLFVTDGDPNASNNPGGAEVDDTGMPVTAATEAVQWINAIRAAGSPIIAIGFGQVATAGYLDAAFTGNSTGPGNVSLETASVIKMPTVNDLPAVLGTLGNQMCGTLSLNKKLTAGPIFYHPIATGATSVAVNDTLPFTLELTNNATTPMAGLEVQDQVPSVLTNLTVAAPALGSPSLAGNLIKWSGINLPARQTATLSFTGQLAKTYTAPAVESHANYAQLTAAPAGYTATALGNMNAVNGPVSEADESAATFTESVYQQAVDPCLGANKPASCYLWVSKAQKNPGAEDDSCTSSASGGAVHPCPFTITVSLSPTYIPSGSTVTVADSFTVGGTPVSPPWAAAVPASFCPSGTPTAIPFTCNHGSLNSFSGDVTVMIPPGQTGQKQNCITVTITNASPPLNVSQTACATI